MYRGRHDAKRTTGPMIAANLARLKKAETRKAIPISDIQRRKK